MDEISSVDEELSSREIDGGVMILHGHIDDEGEGVRFATLTRFPVSDASPPPRLYAASTSFELPRFRVLDAWTRLCAIIILSLLFNFLCVCFKTSIPRCSFSVLNFFFFLEAN